MADRSSYGTAPIRCGRTRCKWRGFETELAKTPHPKWANVTQNVCPSCGCDNYLFMTQREIAAWEKTKAARGVSGTPLSGCDAAQQEGEKK